jgi:flagellar export protein FliJ
VSASPPAAARPQSSIGAAAKEGEGPSDKQNVPEPVFHFRLERVRAVRERKETIAKQELAKAISRRTSTEDELQSVDADLEQARVEQRNVAAEDGVVSATELLARQAFLERVEAQRHLHSVELERREVEVADRGAKLTAAASEHEMLNRLRDRRRGEHDRERARLERNALDEMAVVRFGRSNA